MNKEDTLKSIIEVTNEHNLKMRQMQATLKGQKVYETPPEMQQVCFFATWLHDNNNHLESILGALFYNNLEKFHTQWYEEYIKIYNIFFKKEESGILLRLLHAPKADEKEIDRAKIYYLDLEIFSGELLRALRSSQRRVEALNESKFDDI